MVFVCFVSSISTFSSLEIRAFPWVSFFKRHNSGVALGLSEFPRYPKSTFSRNNARKQLLLKKLGLSHLFNRLQLWGISCEICLDTFMHLSKTLAVTSMSQKASQVPLTALSSLLFYAQIIKSMKISLSTEQHLRQPSHTIRKQLELCCGAEAQKNCTALCPSTPGGL